MTRAFVHYTIENELATGLTDKDLVEIYAYIQAYKRTKLLRSVIYWVFGHGTQRADFVTRGIEAYRLLPQGWITWAMFSWLPVVMIAMKYSPDRHFGIGLITSYALASLVYVILRILLENGFLNDR